MSISYARLDALADRLGCPLLRDEPMSRHTTFRIGGPADRLVKAPSLAALRELLALIREERLPLLVLGNGSDLLVADKGIRGVVLALEGDFKAVTLQPDGRTLTAGAGASLAALCTAAREHSLTGLEFAWGIPGSVGGGVRMNAGAYGGELKEVVTSVTHLTPDGRLETVSGPALDFSYRHSRYADTEDVILSAQVALAPGDPAAIAARMDDLMARRKAKQPYDLPSAGSVFKRPAGGYASALVDQCGLKGASVGGAQVSPKHAGFIVNTGGATCADVLALVARIQQEVLAQTGVSLECEILPVGDLS